LAFPLFPYSVPLTSFAAWVRSDLEFWRAALLGCHYVLEATSGIGCVILFHWIVDDTFIITTTQVYFFKEVSLAWAVLWLLEAGLLTLALRWTAARWTPAAGS